MIDPSPTGDAPPPSPLNSRRLPLLPLVLLILSIGDLSTPLQLLTDHFTFTTLFASIAGHPLAVVVLAAQPSLWRRYGSRR